MTWKPVFYVEKKNLVAVIVLAEQKVLWICGTWTVNKICFFFLPSSHFMKVCISSMFFVRKCESILLLDFDQKFTRVFLSIKTSWSFWGVLKENEILWTFINFWIKSNEFQMKFIRILLITSFIDDLINIIFFYWWSKSIKQSHGLLELNMLFHENIIWIRR